MPMFMLIVGLAFGQPIGKAIAARPLLDRPAKVHTVTVVLPPAPVMRRRYHLGEVKAQPF